MKFDSPAGTWEISWKYMDAKNLVFHAQVPEGCSARIILPGMNETMNGGTFDIQVKPI